jgi:hypothetical protein
MPQGSVGGSGGADDDFTGRLVKKYARRAFHEGYVEGFTLLSDVPTDGDGGASSDTPAVKLWRVRFESIDDEELLAADLEVILQPGYRRGFGKAAKSAATAPPIVARKVAELPLVRDGAGNAGAARRATCASVAAALLARGALRRGRG